MVTYDCFLCHHIPKRLATYFEVLVMFQSANGQDAISAQIKKEELVDGVGHAITLTALGRMTQVLEEWPSCCTAWALRAVPTQ